MADKEICRISDACMRADMGEAVASWMTSNFEYLKEQPYFKLTFLQGDEAEACINFFETVIAFQGFPLRAAFVGLCICDDGIWKVTQVGLDGVRGVLNAYLEKFLLGQPPVETPERFLLQVISKITTVNRVRAKYKVPRLFKNQMRTRDGPQERDLEQEKQLKINKHLQLFIKYRNHKGREEQRIAAACAGVYYEMNNAAAKIVLVIVRCLLYALIEESKITKRLPRTSQD